MYPITTLELLSLNCFDLKWVYTLEKLVYSQISSHVARLDAKCTKSQTTNHYGMDACKNTGGASLHPSKTEYLAKSWVCESERFQTNLSLYLFSHRSTGATNILIHTGYDPYQQDFHVLNRNHSSKKNVTTQAVCAPRYLASVCSRPKKPCMS